MWPAGSRAWGRRTARRGWWGRRGSTGWGPHASAARQSRVPSKPASTHQRPQPLNQLTGKCVVPAGGVTMVSGGHVGALRRSVVCTAAGRGRGGSGGGEERPPRRGSGRSRGCCQPSSGRARSVAAAARRVRALGQRGRRAQCAALSASSASSSVRACWAAAGPRPVRGGGEGGAQAPAARKAG